MISSPLARHVLQFAILSLQFAICSSLLSAKVPYSVGSWSDTLGNHRARIQVAAKADAVWTHLPWRRHDRSPEKKQILIVDAATGKTVENVARINVNPEFADLVFQPATAPGEYYVYYAPYQVQPGSGGYTGDYLPPKEMAAVDWLNQNGLTAEQLAKGEWKKLPQAKVLEFQARTEFDRFDPMEVTATTDEVKKLLAEHTEPYLVFPEDRQYPIRMRDDLPLRWIQSGPSTEFVGEADRNEYYAFQIGICTAQRPLEDVKAFCEPLRSAEGGVIPPPVCFNTGGIDWLGRAFRKTLSVPQGRVQALWFGVDIPRGATPGQYVGNVIVAAKNVEPTPVQVILNVTENVREDRGDGEPWRHSRLRWLNSTLGMDDAPTAPYTPLVRKGAAIQCLGREVTLGPAGLPAQIRCGGRDLLAAPLRFVVETATGSHVVSGGKPRIVKQRPGRIAWVSEGEAAGVRVGCIADMEFDGHMSFFLICQATKLLEVQDLRLELPVRRQAAPYFMGIGHKGGLRQKEWSWKWGGREYYDSFWIGDVPAGLHCELRGTTYSGPLVNLYWMLGQLQPPAAWNNAGQGGCTMAEDGDTVLLRAYSGPRKLQAGRPLEFEFALLPTPVKPLDTASHFRQRYYHAYEPIKEIAKTGACVVNLHHATEPNPYINYPFLAVDKLRAYIKEAHAQGMKLKIYYTVRELTNHVAELWALRSLGHEVLAPGRGGGYPWLREHLVDDYTPAWYNCSSKGDVCAAVLTSGASRWYNYHVEGLRWLVENVGIDGLYLDDVTYDRETLKRIRKVLARRPGCLIDLHSNTAFSRQPTNQYMEFFPYIDRLWFGESFNYDEPPDYWLVEISGIPYGVMGEMLQGGGNPWRGMLYGMTTRLPWSGDPRPLWKAWDEFGIAQSRMIGYWDPACPVHTNSPDVLATAYVRHGKALIAVASWAKGAVDCRVKVDWKALGIDPKKAALTASEIKGFQPAARFAPTDAIPVQPGRGWVLVVSGG